MGVVSGLVGSTPMAGYIDVQVAIVTGIISGIVGWLGVRLSKSWMSGYDDALDVFAIHGIVGIWGSLATGIFCSESLSGTPGLLEGNVSQFFIQLVGVVTIIVFSFLMSMLLFFISGKIAGGYRISEEAE